MTEKLYLNDSYTTTFTASVSESKIINDKVHVKLEKTWFYPESGGQPSDRGYIGTAKVLDVQLDGDEVIHICNTQPDAEAKAEIDFVRRFDHMQQHSGQHMLTAAAIELFDAGTVGFHLGETVSTIDIEKPSASPAEIEQLEQLCQQWIMANMPITAKTVTRQEFDRMELRKKSIPDHVSGDIRLIAMGDVDICHCGGTHLRSTAEIQTIKIIATEKVRDTVRLSFIAGERAIIDYSFKHDLVSDLSTHFTTGLEDLKQIVLKQQRENIKLKAKIKKIGKDLAEQLAQTEVKNARSVGTFRAIVKHYSESSGDELRSLAQSISRQNDDLIFIGLVDDEEKTTVICTAGKEFSGDLGELVKKLNPLFAGKGGGRGTFAQAVGSTGREKELIAVIEEYLSGLQ
jgi:alanyl-tRNA synthetase